MRRSESIEDVFYLLYERRVGRLIKGRVLKEVTSKFGAKLYNVDGI